MNYRNLIVKLFLSLVITASLASAVGTSYFNQNSAAELHNGDLDNVVVTNLGDLKLSRAMKTLLDQDPRVSSVNVLAEGPDGSIYAGTGPHAVLLRIQGEKVSTYAEIPNAAAVLSLVITRDGTIFLGTGGERGQVLKIEKPGEAPKPILDVDGVQYIWGLTRTSDGNLYAATGPAGQLFEIKPDGTHRVLLDSGEANLLSLISDGKDLLYVGTDPHGLIYRVNRATGESFVLYNCPESEVSALALDKDGNLYAGTSEAKEEAPLPPAAEPPNGGRPDAGPPGVPIPADRPKEPTPPPPPNPNPGQPDPIPKASANTSRAAIMRRLVSRSQLALHARRPASISLPAETAPIMLAMAVDTDSEPTSKKKPGKPAPGPGPIPNPNPSPKPAPKPSPQTGPAPVLPKPPIVNTPIAAEARTEGNAIYRIDRDGFVSEIFRQPVLILAMSEHAGTLTVATGGAEGQVFQIRPSADETLILARVDAKQIMSLLPASDGKTYVGTANVGSIAAMSSGFASKGVFTSQVLDATQISRFGKMNMHGSLPAGTKIAISTRSGNVMEPSEKTWSKWSDEAPASEFVAVTAPSARFLQYRMTLAADEKATTSPVARDINIAYQIPNMAPVIKSVAISAVPAPSDLDGSRRAESSRNQTITWEATDPNNDPLSFTLFVRAVGQSEWIMLKDKLTESQYDWDTRTIADGRYEVKVEASDAAANPPGAGKTASRMSDPIVVDNTPPVIGDVRTHVMPASVTIDLKVVDRTSTIAAVDYVIDSGKEWQFVLPVDQIYDSPEELVSIKIAGLSPGPHQVTLRATDSRGNQSFENVLITVPKAEK